MTHYRQTDEQRFYETRTPILRWRMTTAPDYSGWNFYVADDGEFSVTDYADAYNLAVSEIDQQSIKAVNDAVSGLSPDQFLVVWHSYK